MTISVEKGAHSSYDENMPVNSKLKFEDPSSEIRSSNRRPLGLIEMPCQVLHSLNHTISLYNETP